MNEVRIDTKPLPYWRNAVAKAPKVTDVEVASDENVVEAPAPKAPAKPAVVPEGGPGAVVTAHKAKLAEMDAKR